MLRWKTEWLGAVMLLFGRNWITMFGAILTTASAVLIIAFLLLGLIGHAATPYLGIMAFLVLPGIFVFGLAIIPLGVYWQRRTDRITGRDRKAAGPHYPIVDFNKPHTREALAIVVVLTAVNLFIISTVSYRGVLFMDSVEFCGTVCHTVMEPEHTAYLNSPHARVECVECHIGPGAPWFVRSKLSGVGQVFAVAFRTFSHPIPTPVENLRPSRDTCEQCHWPERFAGDRVKVITEFSEDEANSPVQTVLLMHIGGGNSSHGGIHSWHIDPSKTTTYLPADETRQEIPFVQVETGGAVKEYVAEGAEVILTEEMESEMRVMDCIDCHNRPSHIFKLPAQAMDEAMAAGRIDHTLPYIKKIGVEVLDAAKGDPGDLEQIAEGVQAYYQENYLDLFDSEREGIDRAIREIQAIYRGNVFPGMDITWGTYPNNIGHVRYTGCFRCHDDTHMSENGSTIRQDCDICHTILAWQEESPEILQQLGME